MYYIDDFIIELHCMLHDVSKSINDIAKVIDNTVDSEELDCNSESYKALLYRGERLRGQFIAYKRMLDVAQIMQKKNETR